MLFCARASITNNYNVVLAKGSYALQPGRLPGLWLKSPVRWLSIDWYQLSPNTSIDCESIFTFPNNEIGNKSRNVQTYSMSVSEDGRPRPTWCGVRIHVLDSWRIRLRCRLIRVRHWRCHVRVSSHQLSHIVHTATATTAEYILRYEACQKSATMIAAQFLLTSFYFWLKFWILTGTASVGLARIMKLWRGHSARTNV